MSRDITIGEELFKKIGVVATSVLDFPCFHGITLDEFVRLLTRKPLANKRKQNGLAVPHTQAKA